MLLSSPTIEYVAEVAWHDEVNDPPPGGASFVSASSGCDGRRAHGTTRKVRMLSLKMPEDGRDVAIFAAWATEHEAVSLTEEGSKYIYRRIFSTIIKTLPYYSHTRMR